MRGCAALLLVVPLVACSGTVSREDLSLVADAAVDFATVPSDASIADARAALDGGDAGTAQCSFRGAVGQCIAASDCTPPDQHAFAGHCPGPASIECCMNIKNPAFPAGYKLMTQKEVTPAMTAWAVAILHDPSTYPMFATTTMTFGSLNVLARVEWHVPDKINMAIHRGVTLYEPV